MLILGMVSLIGNCQFKLTDNYLTIGGNEPEQGLNFTIKGKETLQWNFKTHDFNIDLTGKYPILGTSQKFYFRLTGDYNLYQFITFNRLFVCSDGRLKTNIENMGPALGIINSLKTLIPSDKKARSVAEETPKAHIDAKSIEAVLPGIVMHDDSITTVNQIALIPVMLQAVKELKEAVDKQDEIIKQLQNRSKNKTP